MPINNGPYRNALVQMSRLPSATRPIAFTFELDKMIEFAHPMFVMMIADQVSHRNQFSEGGLVDEIGTYTWLNAIITPIARTLAWMFEGVMPRKHDDYTIRITNDQGDMQGSWKGLTPTRAGQVQYWVNLIDQAILCKEEALQRAQGDKEARMREMKKVTTTPKGCHVEVNWTKGLQSKRLHHKTASSIKSDEREIVDQAIAPQEITVRVPQCIAQEAIAKLETCIQTRIRDARIWVEAEKNVGINQKDRAREKQDTDEPKTMNNKRMARKIKVGRESCYQIAISAEEIVEQMSFSTAIRNLQNTDCKEWAAGIEWQKEDDRRNQDAKHTPLAKLWRIPDMTHSFLTVTIPQGAHEATSVKEFGNTQDWPIQNNRTPDKLEYQRIGERGGHKPKKHTHYTAATTALLLAGAAEPTTGGRDLTLEQQYMRRKERRPKLATPQIATKGGNVIMRNKLEEPPEKEARDARETLNALNMEVIPSTIVIKGKTKYIDKARFITEETPVKAGNIVVRTTKNLCKYEKERSKRRNQRAHVETIDRRKWEKSHKTETGREKTRLWDEPYKCPMSPDAFVMLTACGTGVERPC